MNSPGAGGRARRGGPISSTTTAPARPTGSPPRPAGSARGAATAPGSPKRTGAGPGSPPGSPGPPSRIGSAHGGLGRGASDQDMVGPGSPPMSRVSSYSDCRKDNRKVDQPPGPQESSVGLFHIIQQLAAAENALWNILDGLKTNTTHSSFFCREYWGCSCSQAQLSLERLNCQERLKRQVQQACVLESLSLGVTAHLCCGVMQGISVTIRSRLRNLLYYIHENCLVLLDLVCQRWMLENQNNWQDPVQAGHCPENLNLDILIRVKRYRRLRKGEHVMALRQHNEMIVNVVRQLCRGAAPKRPPLSSRGAASPGDRSPGGRAGAGSAAGGNQVGTQTTVLSVVNDVLTARGMPLDRLRPSTIRAKMLQYMTFRPLLNVDGADPECPWPTEDPYLRYGIEQFAQDAPIIWFEPLPPMLPNLEQVPLLTPHGSPDIYTLVLDLDETLVHYFEHDGMGNYDIRPGMHEFLERMSTLGYELVIFTAATQDYADWVIDQIDPGRLIHHRLYRQHALPWGPIFVKDMSRIGRDLERTLIIDNVQENFMLQPNNGIFIVTWYDDPHDTALFALTPLLDELIATRSKVPEILDKYRDQIPTWAGFDQFSQLGGEYSEYDLAGEDGLGQETNPAAYMGQEMVQHQQQAQPAPCQPQAAQQQFQQQPPMQQHQQQQQQQQPQHYHQPAVRGPLDGGHQDWELEAHEDNRPATGVYTPQATHPSYMAPQDPSAGNAGQTQSYAGRYQPQQTPQQYVPQQRVPAQPQQTPQHQPGGYPQPQYAAPAAQQHHEQLQHHQQHQAQASRAQGQPQLQQPMHQQAQARPQAMPQAGAPRPAFASGVAGPYQAAPAQQQPQPQMAQGSAAWGGRSGFGPLQAPPVHQQVAHRR